jgi:hypothetical protein
MPASARHHSVFYSKGRMNMLCAKWLLAKSFFTTLNQSWWAGLAQSKQSRTHTPRRADR